MLNRITIEETYKIKHIYWVNIKLNMKGRNYEIKNVIFYITSKFRRICLCMCVIVYIMKTESLKLNCGDKTKDANKSAL